MKLIAFILLLLLPAALFSNPDNSDKELFVIVKSGNAET